MLKVRRLQLRAVTAGPVCGVDLGFSDGLNVLRADNSSGKSTCLQAIIYGLGLEGMLSPRREVPLPHAMTDSIQVEGREYAVLSSFVRLEIENGQGRTLSLERLVKGGTADRGLVKTIEGPALSLNDHTGRRRDYFVRRSGATQREAGLHHALAAFLGWQLPRVTRTDGSEGPLYLECVFPYFFVEQKHGWLGLQARIPTYFQIRDVARRSAEFVLDLEAYSRVLLRQRLEAAATVILNEWRSRVAHLQGLADSASVIVRGIPPKPPESPDQISFELVIPIRNEWISVDAELSRLRSELEEAARRPISTVGASLIELEPRLERAQSELTATTAALTEAIASAEQADARVRGLELRLSALEEDLQRHKDAATLRKLGSRHTSLLGDEAHCPTCQQSLPDGFDITLHPMSEQQSTTFIEQEVRSFRAMHQDALRRAGVEQARVQRLRRDTTEWRTEIRAIKDTLTAPSAMPSSAEIAARLRLETQISTLEKVLLEVGSISTALSETARSWQDNRRLLEQMGSESLSREDRAKLEYVRQSFTGQLREYGFDSMDPAAVSISEETYRPIHEGFDLGFDLSASDMIRTIWAYLVSTTEAAREFRTNHLCFLALDEPRQQEVQHTGFSAFLRHLARDTSAGAQVIVATSEEEQPLRAMLAGYSYDLTSVPPRTRLLRPLAESAEEW